jgi:hypothetical protein
MVMVVTMVVATMVVFAVTRSSGMRTVVISAVRIGIVVLTIAVVRRTT